ncbi:MAG: leucine-rich repeat domain-containing protein [Clostridia bacterium]|nr:leucine-rich repeat domain-containing protein [Clostridia bacterium]
MSDSNNIKLGRDLLTEGKFDQAKEVFVSIIENDPSLSDAYLGKLLAELEFSSEDMLRSSSTDISENDDFVKALVFADEERKKELEEIAESIKEKRKLLSTYDSDFLEKIYTRATICEETSESYFKNANILRSIGGYRDATLLAVKYEEKAVALKKIEDEEERKRLIEEAAERENKRKKSDAIQIKIYSVAIAILSVFLVFLLSYNLFLKDFIAKQDVLDEIAPLTYDDVTVMSEDDAPWFYVTKDGALRFYADKYTGDGHIVIPDVFENRLVKSIESGAFKGCKKIKSVKMSDFIEECGNNLFDGCTELESVEISKSLKSISKYMFSKCMSLKNITIPDSVESIDNYAFSNCISLTSLTLPNSVAFIGQYSFSSCTALKAIGVPVTVSRVDTGAFRDCNALEEIYYGGTEKDFEKISVATGNSAFTDATLICDGAK